MIELAASKVAHLTALLTTGAGTCLTCANATHTLKSGKCTAVCPAGTAPNGTNFCLPCHDTCATCRAPPTVDVHGGTNANANASRCTSCVTNSNKPYLSGDACTAFCPNATWANAAAGACEPCPATCKTCAAPANYLFAQCTACPPGDQLVAGICSLHAAQQTTGGTARVALLSIADQRGQRGHLVITPVAVPQLARCA